MIRPVNGNRHKNGSACGQGAGDTSLPQLNSPLIVGSQSGQLAASLWWGGLLVMGFMGVQVAGGADHISCRGPHVGGLNACHGPTLELVRGVSSRTCSLLPMMLAFCSLLPMVLACPIHKGLLVQIVAHTGFGHIDIAPCRMWGSAGLWVMRPQAGCRRERAWCLGVGPHGTWAIAQVGYYPAHLLIYANREPGCSQSGHPGTCHSLIKRPGRERVVLIVPFRGSCMETYPPFQVPEGTASK